MYNVRPRKLKGFGTWIVKSLICSQVTMAVPHVMYTSNPIYDYEFSWTIDNFSLSPDDLLGTNIPQVSEFKKYLCLQLRYEYNQKIKSKEVHMLYVSLIESINNAKHSFAFSTYTTICKTDGTILKEATIPHQKWYGPFNLLYYTGMCGPGSKLQLSQYMNLLDDKLVVKGKILFSGYHTSCSVSSLIAKGESEASKELSKDFKNMYEGGASSDITFSVGEKTLRAHKTILVVRSPVFAKMFESDLTEKNSNNVVIEDADFHAFNCFLMFLYSGTVEDKKWDTAFSLYSLAHKYQVKSLLVICSEILCNCVTVDTACRLLVLSDLHGDNKLKDAVKVFIRRNWSRIGGTTDWADIVLTTPLLAKEVLV